MHTLHDEVGALNISNWTVRALLHVMIDSGQLTSIECQYEECPYERAILPRRSGRGHSSLGPAIDHIVPRLRGGSDRLENLRLVHANCNIHRARGWKQSEEVRERFSEIRRQLWAEGVYDKAHEKREPGWNTEAMRRIGAERRGQPSPKKGKHYVTECRNGHPYDEGNSYHSPNGVRQCRTCRREGKRRRAAKLKEA